MSRRMSYTADFKRRVILFAENSNNCAAQREFGVNEKLIRGWRKQRDELFACSGLRRAFRGPTTGRHDALEKELRLYVEEERAKGLHVSCEDIQTKARQLALRGGIGRSAFKASRGWVQKFMRRNGLSLRRRTTICQRLPAEYEERLVAFQRYVIKLRQEHNYLLGQIGNADQTPVYFDMPSRTTVTAKGAKDVRLLTTGNEHTRFTVMLCCTADGWKLPPYIVFRRKTIPKGEVFPAKVIIRANEKGFMNEEMVKEWFRMVWMRRPGANLKLQNMLVLDSFRGHICPGVKEAVREAGTDLVIIPGGMTSQLQPLDVSVNKPFKARVAASYKEWLARDDAAKTPTGRRKKAPLSEVAAWVKNAWEDLPADIIRAAFKKCCISNALDGTEDDAVWDAEDASEASDDDDISGSSDDDAACGSDQ